MTLSSSSSLRKVTAALAALLLGIGLFPSLAGAQEYPPYAQPPGYGGGPAEVIHGTIASINGTWNISVNDDRGYVDNVGLHQGTVINPTGLTLEPGMQVTIDGYADGDLFEAQVIDTPYQYGGPPPAPVYYGPGWWYPGFAYGYGPAFSLTIGAGFIAVRHPWVGHWYLNRPIAFAPARPVYRGGQHYVAPAYRGPSPGYRGPSPVYRAPQTYNRPSYHGGGPAARAPQAQTRGRGGAERGDRGDRGHR